MLRVVGCNISTQIGLPDPPSIEGFQEICKNKLVNVNYQPITLLSGFLHTPEDAFRLHERLKLSAYERDLAFFLSQNKDSTKNIDQLMYELNAMLVYKYLFYLKN
jgi:tRNA nucleotidyltransferase (CCA-adding enzyme)